MIEGTSRVEAFSDGVMAIIVTLLIFEVHVPGLTDTSISGVLMALLGIAPKMISFAVSFLLWRSSGSIIIIFSRVSRTQIGACSGTTMPCFSG